MVTLENVKVMEYNIYLYINLQKVLSEFKTLIVVTSIGNITGWFFYTIFSNKHVIILR